MVSAHCQDKAANKHAGFKVICEVEEPGIILLTKDDTLVVKCDSLFAITPMHYRTYELSRQYIMSLNPEKTEKEIISLRQELEQIKATGKAIGLNYDSLEVSFSGHLADQQKMVIQLQNDLTVTRNDLELSRLRIKAIGDDLQKSKQANRTKNLLFASGGLVSGLFLGLLIAN